VCENIPHAFKKKPPGEETYMSDMFICIEFFLSLYFGNNCSWNNEAQFCLFTYFSKYSQISAKGQKFDFRSFLFLYCFNGSFWPDIAQDMLAIRLIQLYRILGQDEFVEDKDISDKSQNLTGNLTEIVRSIFSKWNAPTIFFTELQDQIDITPPPTKRSITNCLPMLAKEGIIRKTKGKWTQIEIISK
jgi:hypothetical protein